MADYFKSTGASGTMLIRQTGKTVEFWLYAANPDTYNLNLGWSYNVNGVGSGPQTFRFLAGQGYQKLGTVTANYNQTVIFSIGNSETVGLGGPTDFFQAITVFTPPTISAFSISAISPTEIKTAFAALGGGEPVVEYQLTWNTIATGGQWYLNTTERPIISGLTKGTLYYVWVRARGSTAGWGPWSGPIKATTWSEPPPPTPVTFANVTQNSLRTLFNSTGTGGTAIIEWELAYGLDPAAPQIFVPSTGTLDLSNLVSGETYYFWARGRNSVGWGAYSAVRAAVLVAGAFVKNGLVWKRAVPYVNDEGVWKLAKPFVKAAGIWKETAP